MEERRGQEALLVPSPNNPLLQLQARFKDVEKGFRDWLSKQSMPVEAAVVTATSAIQGGAIGALMGTLTSDLSSPFPTPPPEAAGLNPQAMASFKQAQVFLFPSLFVPQLSVSTSSSLLLSLARQALSGGPLAQARNFAVMTGVNAGISCVMKRIRGKEDVQTSMVAAFGSGAMFSLVSGMGGPNQAANAVTSGLFFALVQGGLFKVIVQIYSISNLSPQLYFKFSNYNHRTPTWHIKTVKLGQKFSQPPAEDIYYSRTRCMLSSLGLQDYEKNFKKGLLTDSTLPLLTDRQVKYFLLLYGELADLLTRCLGLFFQCSEGCENSSWSAASDS
ncbi:hypothetical protein Syun_010159 [Stephania yunnanensis]|uniref:Mitochondrial import inner membrane translocase subunit TIM22 n=1 Tax=Stephania yunnanensis TaxID=152371 RepID=A0AAP0KGZ7_9MAGN